MPASVDFLRLRSGLTRSLPALTVLLAFGVIPAAASAEELSRYRSLQFGMDLPTVAKLVGSNPAEAKLIHSRPALIQELAWRPQPLGSSVGTEPAKDVALGFYNGELYRVAVKYDRYETEGLTAADIIQAISADYGVAAKPEAQINAAQGQNTEQGEILARWQDSQYSFDLIRTAYGPSFQLIGVSRRIEVQARAAALEAERLDDKEAPQRDAARRAREGETERAKLEKARIVNKPKFRP